MFYRPWQVLYPLQLILPPQIQKESKIQPLLWSMKILIIEDEPTLASAISDYLEREGNLCEKAASFEEAWMK